MEGNGIALQSRCERLETAAPTHLFSAARSRRWCRRCIRLCDYRYGAQPTHTHERRIEAGIGAGELRCEVLTEALDPISGLSLADADPVTSNSTALRQTWNGDAKKIDSLRGQQIRLRFHMDNMDLFSFKAVVV